MSSMPFILDPYRPGKSVVHRLDARIKLSLTLAFILATALQPVSAWPVYILLISIAWSWASLSSLGVMFVLKRALIAFPFALAAIPLPFTMPSEVNWAVHIFDFEVTVGMAGLLRFLSIALKSWISVQAAILLAATTRLPDLLVALRALRLPSLLVTVIGLMWRYMFVLVEEAARLLRARQARSSTSGESGRKTGGTLAWRARVAGGMAGGLFLRSIERSERVYAAMLARGYDGIPRTLPQPPIPRSNWLVLIFGLCLFLFLLLVGIMFGGGI